MASTGFALKEPGPCLPPDKPEQGDVDQRQAAEDEKQGE